MWIGVWLLWPNVVGNSFLASLVARRADDKHDNELTNGIQVESSVAPSRQGRKRRRSEPQLWYEHDCVQRRSYAITSRPTGAECYKKQNAQ
ncbi:uncharacterized protein EDB91DRAFT_1105264 [Suillus paluster]|uniref:uncharacterized protein n=1 Tax=Suillus paluster TaxID=48578 RepID=UPI001B8738D9|nr:uncharacterized protein EDB91DRAFT_1105264 [Suillus paluster]KAG1751394.1 hypothetical protein EDB91DRAFT_1105264 [Suillus paluster]